MKYTEQSYGGKTFRPIPFSYHSSDKNFLCFFTHWGPKLDNKKIIDICSEHYNTSFLNSSTELILENNINEFLYSLGKNINTKVCDELNVSEWNHGFEATFLLKKNKKMYFLKQGQPNILVQKDNSSLTPLFNNLDFSDKHQSSPVPNNLWYSIESFNPLVSNFSLLNLSKIWLVSRSSLPSRIFQLNTENLSEKILLKTIASSSENTPFWLCQINI